ncbi:hypothetical protein [Streptomyces mayteni]
MSTLASLTVLLLVLVGLLTATAPPATGRAGIATAINDNISRLVRQRAGIWSTATLDELTPLYQRWRHAVDGTAPGHSSRA